VACAAVGSIILTAGAARASDAARFLLEPVAPWCRAGYLCSAAAGLGRGAFGVAFVSILSNGLNAQRLLTRNLW
jgi:hypothetical protein